MAGGVGAIGCVQADHRLDRVRAFVKIQDGCSFSCSFCVIPLVRGATRSRSADAVLADVRRRVSQGHREIVLTGVNLGCFRDRGARMSLAGLVRDAGSVPGVERLRLSSIEINHVDDALVAALRETPAVSRHLHVPLQSGDDRVLGDMRRRYSVSQYLAKLAPLRDFNLTTDVIVGFPTEDEAAFAATLRPSRRPGSARCTSFPTRRVLARRRPRPTRFPLRSNATGAPAFARIPTPPAERAGGGRVGTRTASSSTVTGLGYADDYTPWLVDAPVGAMVRARAVGVADEGVLAVVA